MGDPFWKAVFPTMSRARSLGPGRFWRSMSRKFGGEPRDLLIVRTNRRQPFGQGRGGVDIAGRERVAQQRVEQRRVVGMERQSLEEHLSALLAFLQRFEG